MTQSTHCLIDRSIALVRAYLLSPGMTKLGLAKAAGMSDSMVRDVHSEDWNPKADTLRRLEQAIPPKFKAAFARLAKG